MKSKGYQALYRKILASIGIIFLCGTPHYLVSAKPCNSSQCSKKACGKKKDCCKPRFQGTTTFLPRSQGANTARELVGWQRQLYQCYDSNYAAIASTIEYTRSFGTECIAKRFFTTECLTFEGSQVQDRKEGSIVADYFGLATDFQGTLAIKPRIENVIIDINMYFGLDAWTPGLYLRINTPIVHTRWTLGLDDCIACTPKFRGCTQFPDCYMFTCIKNAQGECSPTPFSPKSCPTPTRNPRTPPACPSNPNLNPPRNLKNGNCTTQSLRDALSGNFTFGDMTEPWNFGKFSFCPRSKTGLADIDVLLGFNLVQNDYEHAGFFGVLVIPTGNRPKGRYIFEPIVGDGRHWKLGGGLSCHYSLYPTTEDSCFNVGIYVEGRLVNMFKTDQIRSFDFKREKGEETHVLSRYILLKEYDTDCSYNGTMINAINFATRNCVVSIGPMADISAKAFISSYGWEFDIGYNFYYRHREKVCIKTECPCPIDSRIFAIKGLEGVCCTPYMITDDDTVIAPTTFPSASINTKDNNATMFNPQLPTSPPVINPPVEGTDFETVCLSWNSMQLEQNTPFDDLDSPPYFGIDTTIEPTAIRCANFISCANLDPRSAAQGEMRTHKVFGHISYTFEQSCYSPNIGIGAEGEFDACNKNALQHWGIWVKGGVTF